MDMIKLRFMAWFISAMLVLLYYIAEPNKKTQDLGKSAKMLLADIQEMERKLEG